MSVYYVILSKYQSPLQRGQVQRIASLGGSGGTLDYVAAWFVKAGEYVNRGNVRIGLVATNSITQGEQVAQLWPILFGRHHLEIAFAHRTFAWGSDARGMAHVHVVVIGLSLNSQEPPIKRLFSYDDLRGDPVESEHTALTAYLFDAGRVLDRHLVVKETRHALCDVPALVIGSKPIDGGNYIFNVEQRTEFLQKQPTAAQFMRPFVGATEFLYGEERWILALQGAPPGQLRAMRHVMKRIATVRRYRLESRSESTRNLAATPTRFHVTVIPDRPFLVVPKVSSERRDYVPIGWLNPPTIPSDLVFVLRDARLWHFGVLTSRMHMAWLRHIGGRLKSDYRYSAGIVYNPFPWPQADERQRGRVEALAQRVLDARARFPDATLADLYDTDVMQPELLHAHRSLDTAADRLYRSAEFVSDRERVEHLFGLYERLVMPPLIPVAPTARRRSRARR